MRVTEKEALEWGLDIKVWVPRIVRVVTKVQSRPIEDVGEFMCVKRSVTKVVGDRVTMPPFWYIEVRWVVESLVRSFISGCGGVWGV